MFFLTYYYCHFGTTVYNGSPYDMRPLSVLSVTLVYCGQMTEWIKMPLGTEVGLGAGDIVLDGDPASLPKKGHSSPHFRPMSIAAKRSRPS